MKSSLDAAAVGNVIALRGPGNTICCWDRGSQFRSFKVARLLRANAPMGRIGQAGDNPAMESFYSLL